jgi:hypothetical protein
MPHYDVRNCGVTQIQQAGAKFGLVASLSVMALNRAAAFKNL